MHFVFYFCIAACVVCLQFTVQQWKQLIGISTFNPLLWRGQLDPFNAEVSILSNNTATGGLLAKLSLISNCNPYSYISLTHTSK
jgi:hypothetical protein